MCLIIHKPKDAKLDLELLHSASQYNPHGYGLMAFTGPQKISVIRDQYTHFEALRRAYVHFAKHECMIHLRLRTRGHINYTNTHPFRVTNAIYMAHNGTLDINCRIPGRSDSWHMANDLLQPLLRRNPNIIHAKSFQSYIAKNIVAAGLAKRCEIQLAYAIGVAEPVSVYVDSFGTGRMPDEEIVKLVRKNLNVTPHGIIEMLDLRRPIYRDTASYGHFGRLDKDFSWERTDKVKDLQRG